MISEKTGITFSLFDPITRCHNSGLGSITSFLGQSIMCRDILIRFSITTTAYQMHIKPLYQIKTLLQIYFPPCFNGHHAVFYLLKERTTTPRRKESMPSKNTRRYLKNLLHANGFIKALFLCQNTLSERFFRKIPLFIKIPAFLHTNNHKKTLHLFTQ